MNIQEMYQKTKNEYSQLAQQHTTLQEQLNQLEAALYRKQGAIQMLEQMMAQETEQSKEVIISD